MKRTINRIIAILFLIIAFLLSVKLNWKHNIVWIGIAVILAVIHIWWSLDKRKGQEKEATLKNTVLPEAALTEVVLLGEDDTRLASWNIYGKNGIVIGRDIGENNVTINLDNSTYASMVDIEHAVLNFSGNSWYIEDISEKNGVSIQKSDGKRYKLSYAKPCKLEKGDIIFIALIRLQIL